MKAELRRKLIATLVVPALGFTVAGTSIAAGDKSDSDTTKQEGKSATSGKPAGKASAKASSHEASTTRDIRASDLIGMKVKNAQGETLGKIDDLVVDVNNDRVYYAVLAAGGVMGLGGKLFAYPISLFHAGSDKDEVVLNVEKEKLKKAPGFERKAWPEWGDSKESYRSEVDRYFGPTVTAKSMPNERLLRASTLLGKDIDDREGRNAGEIKDLVVNLGTSRVHYAVLDLDKNWAKSDRLLPLPLNALTFPPERDKNKDLVLNVAKNQLDTNQGVEVKRWKDQDLNDPTYQKNVESFLHKLPSAQARSE